MSHTNSSKLLVEKVVSYHWKFHARFFEVALFQREQFNFLMANIFRNSKFELFKFEIRIMMCSTGLIIVSGTWKFWEFLCGRTLKVGRFRILEGKQPWFLSCIWRGCRHQQRWWYQIVSASWSRGWKRLWYLKPKFNQIWLNVKSVPGLESGLDERKVFQI